MATTYVSFAAVKAAVSMSMVLEAYGITDLKRSGDELVGKCPIHHGQHNSHAFHASLTKNAWHCFGDCHGGGNVLDFVARLEEVSLRDAAMLLAERFHVDAAASPRDDPPAGRPSPAPTPPPATAPAAPTGASGRGKRPSRGKSRLGDQRAAARILEAPAAGPGESPPLPVPPAGQSEADRLQAIPSVNPPLTFQLKRLDPAHPYLASRGLTAATVETFGLGACAKGLMAGRIAIPIHDHLGQLVAYAGRAISEELAKEEGRYKLPPGFEKSAVLYNLHRAAPLAPTEGLVLVEGYFTVHRLHQAGVLTAVALMGSTLSEAQETLVRSAVGPAGKVTLFLDPDEAGQLATRELIQRFIRTLHVRVVSSGDRHPDELTAEELREHFGR